MYLCTINRLACLLQIKHATVIAYRFLIFTTLTTFLFTGCFEGAPRRHPLDPLGENFRNEGSFTLLVTNFYPPRSGLSDVTINITPGGLSRQTDDAGQLSISGLEEGSYTLTITRPGYLEQEVNANVTAGQTTQLEVPLAGLPVFRRVDIHSVHISRWFPPPEELFRLEIEAEMDDPDGLADIDSLWISIPEYDFSEPLSADSEPGKYTRSIPVENLPTSMQSLYGRDIVLRAKDRSGAINESTPTSLIRVLQETPLAQEPQGLVLLTDPQPKFSWAPIVLNFPFTYRVDIVRVDQNIQNTVQSIEGIAPPQTTLEVSEPLLPGEYFWTVSIVDEFNNRSRSREAGFRIQ